MLVVDRRAHRVPHHPQVGQHFASCLAFHPLKLDKCVACRSFIKCFDENHRKIALVSLGVIIVVDETAEWLSLQVEVRKEVINTVCSPM